MNLTNADLDEFVGSELRVHQGPNSVVVNDATALTVTEGSAALVVLRLPALFETDRHPATTLLEYADWLDAVVGEAARVLEPGGRVAVVTPTVVSHRPFICLCDQARDAMAKAELLRRDEIVWVKEPVPGPQTLPTVARSWVSPHDPPTQHASERILVGSKEQLTRWGGPSDRADAGLPYVSDLTTQAWTRDTADVWFVPASNVDLETNEPEPLPAELVERLFGLHTYVGDLVVDPLCGAGAVLQVAARMERRVWGAEANELLAARARLAITNAHPAGARS